MNDDRTTQQTASKSRGQRLSPELNEFLHMLNALEGRFAVVPANAANSNSAL